MATFDGSSFGERGAGGGGGFQAAGAESAFVVHVIPGGSPVLQTIGGAKSTFSISAQGTASQLSTLRGKVGSSGSLVYVGGTQSAFLSKITDARQLKDNVDIWQWSMEFLT